MTSCKQDHMVCKPKIFTIWPFTEKRLLIPSLDFFLILLIYALVDSTEQNLRYEAVCKFMNTL